MLRNQLYLSINLIHGYSYRVITQMKLNRVLMVSLKQAEYTVDFSIEA